jgi:hypothetical protein
MVNQFANDFDIAEALSDGNLDEDSLFHSRLNMRKVDRDEKAKVVSSFSNL